MNFGCLTAPSISVPLIALATEMFGVGRKHHLDCRCPGTQAQPVKLPLNSSGFAPWSSMMI